MSILELEAMEEGKGGWVHKGGKKDLFDVMLLSVITLVHPQQPSKLPLRVTKGSGLFVYPLNGSSPKLQRLPNKEYTKLRE